MHTLSHCQVKVSIMLYRIVHVQYWIKFKDLPNMRDKWISKCFQFCLDDHSDVQTWSKLLQNLRQEEGEDEKRLQERNKSRVEREGEREREEEEVGQEKVGEKAGRKRKGKWEWKWEKERKRERQNNRCILKDHYFPLVSNENRIVLCKFYKEQYKPTFL